MKSVKTNSCKLCMVEKIEIRKAMKLNPELCLNQVNELYSQFTSAADFYLFKRRNKTDTEDASIAEKKSNQEKIIKTNKTKKENQKSPSPDHPR